LVGGAAGKAQGEKQQKFHAAQFTAPVR
jgi:hypothetical protein